MTTKKRTEAAGRPATPNAQPTTADIVPLRRLRQRCPVCGQTSIHAYRPFCSAACADRDLGRWLNESYRVPAEETPDDPPDEP